MTNRRSRRVFAAAAVCLLCALLLFTALPAGALSLPASSAAASSDAGSTTASPTGAPAAQRRTVRVGVSDADTPAAGGDNRTVAFQKDYAQALAEYANWDCVFVFGSWGECLEKMKRGDLDLLLDVSKTDARLAYFDYSSESMGTEMCYLYGRTDTALGYNDFSGFNGMTVGYEESSTIVDALREYGAANGFSFQARPYSSGAAMFAALDAGEVDAVAQTNYYDTPTGHVILARIAPSPVYVVTNKNVPALKSELDYAMAQLFSYNPSFNADLYEYHFGSLVSQASGYTNDELAYLATKPVVKVYYETNWEPFEYSDGGTPAGITPDILSAIAADTGITFRYVLNSSTKDIYSDLGGDNRDAVMAVSCDYSWAAAHDLLVTQPYVPGAVLRASLTDAAPKTVAVISDGYLAHRIAALYPDLTPVVCLTAADCMNAVAAGKADCTFLNYYQASYYRSMSSYENFTYQPDENITQSIGLGVTKNSDPALFSILSKSLQRISQNRIQSVLNTNSTQVEPLSLRSLLRRYPVPVALSLGGLGVLIGLLVLLLVTSSLRKRQNLQLADAKREADAANSAKSEFLSRMSHDMRTPLNGIIGMTYLTHQMDLPDAAQANLDKIEVSSKFLLSLINDLLDMTKAESGKIELHPEPYTVEEFRRYIDAVIRPLCAGKWQEFVLDISIPDGVVPVQDKLRINQIVFNLLSNAVKYTPEKGRIVYSSRVELLAGNRLAMHICVSDNGIGMSEKFQQVLFTPFMQEARDDNSEFRGSGLGLAITKRLVDLMNGRIAVHSKLGEGTQISVDLVLPWVAASSLPADEGDGGGADAPLDGRHILLCEDHPLNQEIACSLLRAKGLLVEVAEDGQRGVNAFAQSPVGYYDAVLMDIRMPVLDGYGAVRAIRALHRPDAATVPILAMSADVLTNDVEKCLAAGMNGHIPKPIDPGQLFAALAEAIARRRPA